MAEPRLDCLPMELFVMVFEEGCSESDIVHLVRCNKRLLEKLEPIIYSSPDSLSKAMKWACLTGNVGLVRKCIYYGTSVHNSTYLCLASKKQQEKIIRLLVDQGVRILSPDMDKKRRFKGIEGFRYCAKKKSDHRASVTNKVLVCSGYYTRRQSMSKAGRSGTLILLYP
jgi:hypothetical protein